MNKGVVVFLLVVIMTSVAFAQNGINAEYRDSQRVKAGDPSVWFTETVPNINFDWGFWNGPSYNGVEINDYFQTKFTGFIYAKEAGNVDFVVQSNDGHIFAVNDRVYSDTWARAGKYSRTVTVYLNQGYNSFRLEQWEGIYSSYLYLRWYRPSWFACDQGDCRSAGSYELVPANVFYTQIPRSPGTGAPIVMPPEQCGCIREPACGTNCQDESGNTVACWWCDADPDGSGPLPSGCQPTSQTTNPCDGGGSGGGVCEVDSNNCQNCDCTCTGTGCSADCSECNPYSQCNGHRNTFYCHGRRTDGCNQFNSYRSDSSGQIAPTADDWCSTVQADVEVRSGDNSQQYCSDAVVVYIGDGGVRCVEGTGCDPDALDWDCQNLVTSCNLGTSATCTVDANDNYVIQTVINPASVQNGVCTMDYLIRAADSNNLLVVANRNLAYTPTTRTNTIDPVNGRNYNIFVDGNGDCENVASCDSTVSVTCPEIVAPRCGDGLCEEEGVTCEWNGRTSFSCLDGSMVNCRQPDLAYQCTYCGDGICQNTNGPAPQGVPVREYCDPSFRGNPQTLCTDVASSSFWDPGECRNDCTFCGDGVQQLNWNESCDPAAAPGSAGYHPDCTDQCTIAPPSYCGDGICDAGEECEPTGNIDCSTGLPLPTGVVCSSTCEIPEPLICNDACTTNAQCGSGLQCLSGFCRNPNCPSETDCVCAACGDTNCDPGETCEYGTNPDTQCSGGGILGASECRTSGPNACTYCGDGIVQTGEECDDGNPIDGDGCNNDCAIDNLPYCGDGICNGGEECEWEGNIDCSTGLPLPPGVQCTLECTIPPPPEGAYCTFTQGGWGQDVCHGQNVACIRNQYWDQMTFASGGNLIVGYQPVHTMTFLLSENVANYLPATSTPSYLIQNYLNPITTSSGVFGGQVTALKLNTLYSGVVGVNMLDYVIQGSGTSYDGQTVRTLLADAERALGDPNSGLNIGELNEAADFVNNLPGDDPACSEAPVCFSTCDPDDTNSCPTGLVCADADNDVFRCRNPLCLEESDCICDPTTDCPAGWVDLNFDDLLPGQVVDTEYAAQGVLIYADQRNSEIDMAVAYDTNCNNGTWQQCSGEDYDLGTPNEAWCRDGSGLAWNDPECYFGKGPGRGVQPTDNTFPYYNALIIEVNGIDSEPDGLIDDPDDSEFGGVLTVEFQNGAVDIQNVTIIDIDQNERNAKLRYFQAANVITKNLVNAGDNSVQVDRNKVTGVTKLEVDFERSGALAELTYCPPIQPPINGPQATSCKAYLVVDGPATVEPGKSTSVPVTASWRTLGDGGSCSSLTAVVNGRTYTSSQRSVSGNGVEYPTSVSVPSTARHGDTINVPISYTTCNGLGQCTTYDKTHTIHVVRPKVACLRDLNCGGYVCDTGYPYCETTNNICSCRERLMGTTQNTFKTYFYEYGSSENPHFNNLVSGPFEVTEINNDWGRVSIPLGSGLSSADYYAVRWEGDFEFDDAMYRFEFRTDDGMRFYIDDQLVQVRLNDPNRGYPVYNSWRDQGSASYFAEKAMTQGVHTVRVEYYERRGYSRAEFDWVKKTGDIVSVPPKDTSTGLLGFAGEIMQVLLGA